MRPVTRDKKKAHNLDPALRTWLRGQVTRIGFRNTKWAPRSLAVDLAPTTVHDIDEEGLSFYFWANWQYGSIALHWNVEDTNDLWLLVERKWTNSVVDSCGFML